MPAGLTAAFGFAAGVLASGVATAPTNGERRLLSARAVTIGAVTAALFVGALIAVGLTPVLPAYLWFVAVTVTLTITDLSDHRIPNRVLLPGTIVGAALLTVGAVLEAGPILRAYAGGIAYFALLALIAVLSRGGFGAGDVKLAFLLGMFAAYPSWTALIVAVAAAFLLGGIGAVVVLASGLRGRRDAIAFGPYLIAGAYAGIAFAEPIARWYLAGSA